MELLLSGLATWQHTRYDGVESRFGRAGQQYRADGRRRLYSYLFGLAWLDRTFDSAEVANGRRNV